jgi:dTDP-4-amino-4,6-dideoxygalactose transaminase
VAANVHFIPLPLLSFYKGMGYRMEDYPQAYANYSREITLPLFYDLSDENIATVVEALVESVNEVLGL